MGDLRRGDHPQPVRHDSARQRQHAGVGRSRRGVWTARRGRDLAVSSPRADAVVATGRRPGPDQERCRPTRARAFRPSCTRTRPWWSPRRSHHHHRRRGGMAPRAYGKVQSVVEHPPLIHQPDSSPRAPGTAIIGAAEQACGRYALSQDRQRPTASIGGDSPIKCLGVVVKRYRLSPAGNTVVFHYAVQWPSETNPSRPARCPRHIEQLVGLVRAHENGRLAPRDDWPRAERTASVRTFW